MCRVFQPICIGAKFRHIKCGMRLQQRMARQRGKFDRDGEKFLKEMLWREFSYQAAAPCAHFPDKPFKPEYEDFPWAEDLQRCGAGSKGQTGYPIVDAGMRELWATGIMHNRVRMIVASFLIKDLLDAMAGGRTLVLGHVG